MKLPFSLGVKLIFRLLVPGFFLTLGLYPILAALRDKSGWEIQVEYLFILSVIGTGWLVLILDQPIYMFLEGRRYWPQWLRRVFISSEQRRLARILNKDDKFYALSEALSEHAKKKNAYQKYIEATVEQRTFPLNDSGALEAQFPTRLGNLIYAFETYPEKRYRVDAIFFWYRILLIMDKDLREELDNRQAVADSALYACVAFFISGVLWLCYQVLSVYEFTLIGHLPTFLPPWVPAIGFLLLSFTLYRMSLFAQYQFGETFKSVFDIYEKRIDVSGVLQKVSSISKDQSILNADRGAKLWIALRYLHNYKIKCPNSSCANLLPMSPETLKKHIESSHSVKPEDRVGIYENVPKNQDYYVTLTLTYETERYVFVVKALSIMAGITVFGFGLFMDRRLFWAALVIGGLMWAVEVLVRISRKERENIQNLRNIETSKNIPRTYQELPLTFWRSHRVVVPHIIIVLLALVLLILWGTGMLQSLENIVRNYMTTTIQNVISNR